MCLRYPAVIRLPKRELLVLSQEYLKEILHHGRQLAVSGAGAKSSIPSGPPLLPLSRGGMSAIISNDLQARMTSVGLLRQGDEAST